MQVPPKFDRTSFSHLYFPPIQGPDDKPQTNGNAGPTLAEEDLHAASTLQGIHHSPVPQFSRMVPQTAPPRSTDVHMNQPIGGLAPMMNSYSDDHSGFQENSLSGLDIKPEPEPTSLPSDIPGMQPGSGLDDFLLGLDFFENPIFDNPTDWLRDWGPNESISPASLSSENPMQDNFLQAALTPGPFLPDSSAFTPKPFTPKPPEPDLQSMADPSDDEEIEDAPTAHGVPGLPTVSPLKDRTQGGDFLPWAWRRPSGRKRKQVKLPPVRAFLTECDRTAPHPHFNDRTDGMGTVTEDMRTGMINVLAIPYLKPAFGGYDKAELEQAFPDQAVIADFVNMYFTHFHNILPVVHRPTFCIDRCPSTMLIAMVSIGASYSNMKNAKNFADNLSALCKRSLSWMVSEILVLLYIPANPFPLPPKAEAHSEYGSSPFFLQSLCLQNMYAMGSGSTSLYDAADISRSTLIGNARRIGLFNTAPGEPTHSAPPSSPGTGSPNRPTPPADLESHWKEWRDREALKRLAWSIFEYDSSFSTLSNRRGAIIISDITINVPCSDALWDAPNAEAWQHLCQSGDHDPYGQPFYKSLKDVIAGRLEAEKLTAWGKRICAQAIARIMWDFKEMENSIISVGAYEKSMFQPAKLTLLRSLMAVCKGSIGKIGEVESDRYHWVLARLIAHYTHLYSAFATVNRMLTLVRRPPKPGSEANDTRVKVLISSYAADPVAARNLAYHAAQIIALSRWHPVYSPVEGMRLFLAGVVLWGFGRYYDRAALQPRQTLDTNKIIRLDLLPWVHGEDCGEKWVKTGEGKPAIAIMDKATGVERVVDVCGESGAMSVLKVVVEILGSLRFWGLGGEFKGLLEELGARKG